ncbi:MAG: aspartate dehydrogenase [Rhodobacteraceae bacterium]|jgi:aspartate dehydrogenase|nr:aspartate dehydrogenase [Paracoccaceae bacterium]
MKIGLIGNGAIAGFVRSSLESRGHSIDAVLIRPERLDALRACDCASREMICSPDELPDDLDLVADCAGHEALRAYGENILDAGHDLVTVSIGALADHDLNTRLSRAACNGGAKLHLASGAIGALDALRAARTGAITRVRYTGRKPPKGWLGSPAEHKLDLHHMGQTPQVHFTGSAREAALAYPKNANVAAAVALAGPGFDLTEVELIADPTISANIHEIRAEGDFGVFDFHIEGQSLPGNPRSSALAAMSAVSTILQHENAIQF